jgi:hypothetical protein
MAASKDEALQTRALQVGGLRNVDVGCFEIKLQNSPTSSRHSIRWPMRTMPRAS